MELDKNEFQKYKKIVSDTMKAFIAFCDENELRYYACGGTCLGAIRHKGFIPWDDDIDVLMPREDYNKFISLRNNLVSSNYDILYPDIHGYYLPFAKFINKNTTLVEREDFPFVIGTFVDVFPQDQVGDAAIAQKLMEKKRLAFGKYCMAIKKHSVFAACRLLCKMQIKSFVNYCLYSLFNKPYARKHLRDIHKLDLEIQQQKGNKYMCYDGFYGYDKEACEQDWFGEGIEVPFEDYSIRVPQNYHAYLTQMYGDYMTPPPVEKQVSHHYIYFIDLNKRWDIKDVMKLNLKKQNTIEYTYE